MGLSIVLAVKNTAKLGLQLDAMKSTSTASCSVTVPSNCHRITSLYKLCSRTCIIVQNVLSSFWCSLILGLAQVSCLDDWSFIQPDVLASPLPSDITMLASIFALATCRCICYAGVSSSRKLYCPSIATTIWHNTVARSDVFGLNKDRFCQGSLPSLSNALTFWSDSDPLTLAI